MEREREWKREWFLTIPPRPIWHSRNHHLKFFLVILSICLSLPLRAQSTWQLALQKEKQSPLHPLTPSIYLFFLLFLLYMLLLFIYADILTWQSTKCVTCICIVRWTIFYFSTRLSIQVKWSDLTHFSTVSLLIASGCLTWFPVASRREMIHRPSLLLFIIIIRFCMAMRNIGSISLNRDSMRFLFGGGPRESDPLGHTHTLLLFPTPSKEGKSD